MTNVLTTKVTQTRNPLKTLERTMLKAAAASLGVLIACGFTAAVSAGDDTGLHGWAKSADASVDKVMHFPSFAVKRGKSGRSVFHVTVDRDGNVIDSDLVENTGDAALRAAARRVVKRANFPALPAGFDDDRLRFSLRLNYIIAGSPMEARALMRETEVRSEAIGRGTPVAGRITILAQASD